MKLVQIALVLLMGVSGVAQDSKAVGTSPGILSPAEVQRLMPASVFFKGQSASVQIRNSFGWRFSKEGLVLAGMVDTGGYSTALRDKYQFYLLSDTSFEVAGKRLSPGSYGCGFVGGSFVLMDLAGDDLFRSAVTHDDSMARPRPLQMVAGKTPDEFRLYLGRDYIAIRP